MPRAHFIFLSRGTSPRTLPSLQVSGTMRGSEAVSKSDEPTPPAGLVTPSCVLWHMRRFAITQNLPSR